MGVLRHMQGFALTLAWADRHVHSSASSSATWRTSLISARRAPQKLAERVAAPTALSSNPGRGPTPERAPWSAPACFPAGRLPHQGFDTAPGVGPAPASSAARA